MIIAQALKVLNDLVKVVYIVSQVPWNHPDIATNVSVVCYDAEYAANILYNGYTILIITNVTWTYGHTYYVTMDSGFSSGDVFCRKSLKTKDEIFIIICMN